MTLPNCPFDAHVIANIHRFLDVDTGLTMAAVFRFDMCLIAGDVPIVNSLNELKSIKPDEGGYLSRILKSAKLFAWFSRCILEKDKWSYCMSGELVMSESLFALCLSKNYTRVVNYIWNTEKEKILTFNFEVLQKHLIAYEDQKFICDCLTAAPAWKEIFARILRNLDNHALFKIKYKPLRTMFANYFNENCWNITNFCWYDCYNCIIIMICEEITPEQLSPNLRDWLKNIRIENIDMEATLALFKLGVRDSINDDFSKVVDSLHCQMSHNLRDLPNRRNCVDIPEIQRRMAVINLYLEKGADASIMFPLRESLARADDIALLLQKVIPGGCLDQVSTGYICECGISLKVNTAIAIHKHEKSARHIKRMARKS
jgi:hypothetical protein